MRVFGLAFISDTHLGVVLDDGQLRVVTIDPGELLEIARNSLTRGFTEDECDRYNFDPCPSLEEMQNGTGSAPDRDQVQGPEKPDLGEAPRPADGLSG